MWKERKKLDLLSIILKFPIPLVVLVRVPRLEIFFGGCQGYTFVGFFNGFLTVSPYSDR